MGRHFPLIGAFAIQSIWLLWVTPSILATPLKVPVAKRSTCDYSNPRSRFDCGFPGITQSQCESRRNCCYDSTVSGIPYCFGPQITGPGVVVGVDDDGGSKVSAGVVSRIDDPNVKGKIFHAHAGVLEGGTGVEAGAGVLDVFVGDKSQVGTGVHFLTGSVKAGVNGGFARATVIEQPVSLGPIQGSVGLTFDTGAEYDGRNLEVMSLGAGFKVGKDGVKVCAVIFCFGIGR